MINKSCNPRVQKTGYHSWTSSGTGLSLSPEWGTLRVLGSVGFNRCGNAGSPGHRGRSQRQQQDDGAPLYPIWIAAMAMPFIWAFTVALCHLTQQVSRHDQ